MLVSIVLLAGPWVPAAMAADASVAFAASTSSFNPIPDGYQDTVQFTFTLGPEAAKIDVSVSSGGVAVRSWSGLVPASGTVTTIWNGKNGSGSLVTPGFYDVDVVVYDASDVSYAHAKVGSVTVVITTLTDSFVAKIGAQWSFSEDISGKCGQLVRPSSHEWAGSIGYYANGRCKGKTLYATVADGVHQVQFRRTLEGHTPTKIVSVKVSAYGGAARRSAGSRARITWWGNDSKWLNAGEVIGSKVGWHGTPAVSGTKVVWPGRYLVWDVYTVNNNRYDVKTFRLKLVYQYQR